MDVSNSIISMLRLMCALARHLACLQGLQAAIIDHSIKLIIIDSIAALARTEFEAQAVAERQRMLGRQASRLKFLAESFRIPVLVTNQVTTAIGGRGGGGVRAQEQGTRLMAALGPMWAHAVNTRLVLAAQQGRGTAACQLNSTRAISALLPIFYSFSPIA